MQGAEPACPQCVSVCLSLLTERSRPTSGWSELQTEKMSQRKEEGFNEHFSSLKVREINMTLGTRGLTVIGEPAEVLLEAGCVCRRVWGLEAGLLAVRLTGREVGVGGMETRGT